MITFFDCSEKDGFQPDWAAEGKIVRWSPIFAVVALAFLVSTAGAQEAVLPDPARSPLRLTDFLDLHSGQVFELLGWPTYVGDDCVLNLYFYEPNSQGLFVVGKAVMVPEETPREEPWPASAFYWRDGSDRTKLVPSPFRGRAREGVRRKSNHIDSKDRFQNYAPYAPQLQRSPRLQQTMRVSHQRVNRKPAVGILGVRPWILDLSFITERPRKQSRSRLLRARKYDRHHQSPEVTKNGVSCGRLAVLGIPLVPADRADRAQLSDA